MTQKKILQALILTFWSATSLALASFPQEEKTRQPVVFKAPVKLFKEEDALSVLHNINQKSTQEIRQACSFFHQKQDFEKANVLYRKLIQSHSSTVSDSLNFLDSFSNDLRQKMNDLSLYDEAYKKDLLKACDKIMTNDFNDQYDRSRVHKITSWINQSNTSQVLQVK